LSAGNQSDRALLIIGPNIGCLDNWAPVLAAYQDEDERRKIDCLFRDLGVAAQFTGENAVYALAGSSVVGAFIKASPEYWIKLSSVRIAHDIAEHRRPLMHRVLSAAVRLLAVRKGSIRVRIARLSARALVSLTPHLSLCREAARVSGYSCFLFDLWELRKRYFESLIRRIPAEKCISLFHGFSVSPSEQGGRRFERGRDGEAAAKRFALGGVRALLFSPREIPFYRKKYYLPESRMTVVGIPRHEQGWIQRVQRFRRATLPATSKSRIFLASRPTQSILPEERKRRALTEIRNLLIEERGYKLIIKQHPKEKLENLFNEVFGEAQYGDTWEFTQEHVFVAAQGCAFGIVFYSALSLDLLMMGLPVIEYLDLSGIDDFGGAEMVRDSDGNPCLEYRFWGLVYGVGNRDEFMEAVLKAETHPEEFTERLRRNYSRLFPSPEGAARRAAMVLGSET